MIISKKIDKAVEIALAYGQSPLSVARRFNLRIDAVREIAFASLRENNQEFSNGPTPAEILASLKANSFPSRYGSSHQPGLFDRISSQVNESKSIPNLNFAALEEKAMVNFVNSLRIPSSTPANSFAVSEVILAQHPALKNMPSTLNSLIEEVLAILVAENKGNAKPEQEGESEFCDHPECIERRQQQFGEITTVLREFDIFNIEQLRGRLVKQNVNALVANLTINQKRILAKSLMLEILNEQDNSTSKGGTV